MAANSYVASLLREAAKWPLLRMRSEIARRPSRDPSTPAERVVSLVFPIAALVVVGDFHRDHVFRILEPEFCGHPDLHWKTVGPGEDFVGEFERHLGLRMQRGAHVERGVIAF